MEVENVIYPVRFFYFNTPCLIISVSLNVCRVKKDGYPLTKENSATDVVLGSGCHVVYVT